MQPELVGEPSALAQRLRGLDARIKLIVAVGFVAAVVAAPAGWWRFHGAMGLVLAFLIGLSGAEIGPFLRRWTGFLAVVGLLAVMVAPSLPARRELGTGGVVLAILVKNSLAFLMMMLLATISTWLELLQGMRRLGVPRVLVANLQFMERYFQVLQEELGRMRVARRARLFRRGGLSWGLLAGLVGMLLLRSLERAERVQGAMLARGWSGTVVGLDD
jgi:cobalt/nickel transport system permease protein